MNESLAHAPRYTGKIRAKYAEATDRDGDSPVMVEVVGASDATIAEAVRNALSRASQSLRTLDGAGVLVIPQMLHAGEAPRYRVTVQVTAASPDTSSAPTPSPSR
ncbi:MAG: dodecin domain-containing protein [Deltaproteobacteria bacterium]|nr:dodecin domain-containing protein [Deltaproteobacteria bacterium]